MTFVSYAQNLEDVILWRALKDVTEGFYIDVGAWDPREDSVTLAFYERGWRGINVEPDPAKHAALERERPGDINLRVALAEAAGTRPFYVFPGTGWSTLDPAIARRHKDAGHSYEEQFVQLSRLADICELHAPADIHFLKIDVEGAEAAVLAGADLKRHRPWIIMIEATLPNSPSESHAEWEGMVLGAGYQFAYFDGLNRYYVAQERAEQLLPSFSRPPNVFDDFISVSILQRALHYHDVQPGINELEDRFRSLRGELEQHFSRQRNEDDSRHQDMLRAAEARARKAEQRAIDAELRARLAEADVGRAPLPQAVEARATRVEALPMASSGGPVREVFYDAGLILWFGLRPPVGIVRVEQYVAELLAREPGISLRFIAYDQERRAYRYLSDDEQTQINSILFERYRAVEVKAEEPQAGTELAAAMPETAIPPSFTRRVLNVSRMPPEQFDEFLARSLGRRLPISSQQSRWGRLGKRVVRRSAAAGCRIAYGVLRTTIGPLRTGRQALAHLARADVHTQALPSANDLDAKTQAVLTDTVAFKPGDTLITIANTWDYMDYGYLTDVVRKDGVRLVSVIYDVIAMEMPFTTPASLHIYHRHWVELGHLSSHLVAISRHSLDTYHRFIGEPNDLDPPMSYAYLPNFLHERREEIGEKPVPELMGRRFVVFCSTIETRKNHQLLLHAWERLRQQVSPEELPILVFVGGWGWGTETVRLLSERNWRLRDHLRILNKISDAELIWLYRNADFTAFPALSEGFGLAAAESLSFGTPVIVADCPALIEASEGLMPAIDPLDVPGWVAELRRVITDPAYLAELRSRAAQYRGVGYNEFAYAIRDAVLKESEATTNPAGKQPHA